MNVPGWFSGLDWSPGHKIETLRDERTLIPKLSGVYVFSNYQGPVDPCTGILYVGKAKSLHSRLQSYLADPDEILILSKHSGGQRVSSTLRHAGKAQLLVEVQQRMRALGHGESGIWVRWVTVAAPAVLEDSLIKYLQPAFNTQGRAKPEAW